MTTTRTETISVGDATFSAHLALPEATPAPGVLLFQEIFGVNEFLKSKADDLAHLGYAVLCPDVFWRVEPNVALHHDEEALATAFGYAQQYGAIPQEDKVADLLASLAHFRALPEVDDRVAAMGYCLGGWLAYETAVHGDLDACVSYYGSTVPSRLDDAGKVDCPVIFHFGGNDPFIPTGDIEAVRAAFADRLDEANNDARSAAEFHVYEAGHAFENFLAPQFHDEAAAAQSWQRTVAFLARHLGT